MRNKNRSIRKPLVVVIILSLLIMILPLAVMALEGGFVPTLPSQAADRARQALSQRSTNPSESESESLNETEESETEESETEASEPEATDNGDENKSEQAKYIEERNQQAEEWGIPPGFVNLFDKLSALTGESRESIHDRYTNESEPLTIPKLMKEIKAARKTHPTEPTESAEPSEPAAPVS
jgi:hypothetical protein